MTTPCERIGLDDFAAAPVRFTASETIAATPDQVFAVFLDAEGQSMSFRQTAYDHFTGPET